jgi:hypothetical protein
MTWMRLLRDHSIPDRFTYDQFVAPTLVFSTYTVTWALLPRCQRGWARAATGRATTARKVIAATSFRKSNSPTSVNLDLQGKCSPNWGKHEIGRAAERRSVFAGPRRPIGRGRP